MTVIEGQVREIKDGMIVMHDDLKENNRITREIRNDTQEVVQAGKAVAFFAKLTLWLASLSAGAYAAWNLYQAVAK